MNIAEQLNCLICGQLMTVSHHIAYIDYHCSHQNDHHLSWRIVNKNLAKLRIRFKDNNERLCLKIHYDEKYSEVWTSLESSRFRIEQIIIPDFQDIEKL